MYACTIFLMDNNEDVLDSIKLMLPNIPRLGEFISIHNTLIYRAVVIKVVNTYFYTPERPKHEIFENYAVVEQGSCYFHITVKNQGNKEP